jgi:hypothetical protein
VCRQNFNNPANFVLCIKDANLCLNRFEAIPDEVEGATDVSSSKDHTERWDFDLLSEGGLSKTIQVVNEVKLNNVKLSLSVCTCALRLDYTFLQLASLLAMGRNLTEVERGRSLSRGSS